VWIVVTGAPVANGVMPNRSAHKDVPMLSDADFVMLFSARPQKDPRSRVKLPQRQSRAAISPKPMEPNRVLRR
jgi:hypothetical protein